MEADNEQVREVYVLCGMAVYTAQCFEEAFKGALLVMTRLKCEVATPEEFDRLEVGLQKQMLGQLLRELRKKMTLASQSEEALSAALESRNRLTHRFFRDHADNFMTEDGRLLMIDELKEIRRVIQEGHRLVTMYSDTILRLFGVSLPTEERS